METIFTIGFVAFIALIIVLDAFENKRREKALRVRLNKEQEEANRIFASGDVIGACKHLREHSKRG